MHGGMEARLSVIDGVLDVSSMVWHIGIEGV